MKDVHVLRTKFNISWISIFVIFLGAIVYVPLMYLAKKEQEVVYYKVPVYVRNIPEVNTNPPSVTIEAPNPLITKDLRLGDDDPQVKVLQEYLNAKGFIIAESGPGSPGNETTRFGSGTHEAVVRFQEAHRELLLAPFGLTVGTGIVGERTRQLINS